jgi:hypothetical protein
LVHDLRGIGEPARCATSETMHAPSRLGKKSIKPANVATGFGGKNASASSDDDRHGAPSRATSRMLV